MLIWSYGCMACVLIVRRRSLACVSLLRRCREGIGTWREHLLQSPVRQHMRMANTTARSEKKTIRLNLQRHKIRRRSVRSLSPSSCDRLAKARQPYQARPCADQQRIVRLPVCVSATSADQLQRHPDGHVEADGRIKALRRQQCIAVLF